MTNTSAARLLQGRSSDGSITRIKRDRIG